MQPFMKWLVNVTATAAIPYIFTISYQVNSPGRQHCSDSDFVHSVLGH